jgi:hypothetical protein
MDKFFKIECDSEIRQVSLAAYIEYEGLELITEGSPLRQQNRFFVEDGFRFFDVVRLGMGFNFAISDRFKKLLETNRATGWASFPIRIDDVPVPYHILIAAAKVRLVLNAEAENYEFDEITWDGSDIFALEGSLSIACTGRVKQLAEAHGITNIKFKPLKPD